MSTGFPTSSCTPATVATPDISEMHEGFDMWYSGSKVAPCAKRHRVCYGGELKVPNGTTIPMYLPTSSRRISSILLSSHGSTPRSAGKVLGEDLDLQPGVWVVS